MDVRYEEWESKHIGAPYYRIWGNITEDELYTFLEEHPNTHILAVYDNPCDIICNKYMTMLKSMIHMHKEPGAASVDYSICTDEYIKQVKNVAYGAFTKGRLQSDPGIPREVASSMMADWAKNSYESGDVVVIDEKDGIVRGFCSLRLLPIPKIILTAVHPKYQHIGVGKYLLSAIASITQNTGVSVTTELDNTTALGLYYSAGFRSQYVYTYVKYMR